MLSSSDSRSTLHLEVTESAYALLSLTHGLCSGILVTGTVVLEALAQCGTAAFDKTGTLTTGRLAATSMRAPAGTAHLEDAQNGVHCSACAHLRILPLSPNWPGGIAV